MGYWNFQGDVACTHCRTRWWIRTESGDIKEIRPGSTIHPDSLRISPSVPPEITQDFLEGIRCVNASAYRATVVMCRRCVQGALLEKGIADSKLSEMLKDAQSQKLLDEATFLLARGIKLFGDAGAHPKDPELFKVDKDGASLALQTTRMALNGLFPMSKATT